MHFYETLLENNGYKYDFEDEIIPIVQNTATIQSKTLRLLQTKVPENNNVRSPRTLPKLVRKIKE